MSLAELMEAIRERGAELRPTDRVSWAMWIGFAVVVGVLGAVAIAVALSGPNPFGAM